MISAGCFALYLAAMPVYCLLRVFNVQTGVTWLTFAMPLLMTGFALAHMLAQYGGWRGAAMALSAFGISLAAEIIGVSTGWLFGDYVYTERLGPKAFDLVPWLIPCAWLMILYPAWEITRHASVSRLVRPVLAALAITAYDLSLDPRMVADGYWIWHGGGFYFGVPFSNFVGWFVTAWAIGIVWDWLTHPGGTQNWKRLPVWAYIALWLGETIANIFFWSGPVVGVIVFVTMGVFVLPIIKQIQQRDKS